jgi:hypothetical protein
MRVIGGYRQIFHESRVEIEDAQPDITPGQERETQS